MATVTSQGRAGAMHSAELAIGGMTCDSGAARIEKKLNKLDGVAATVDFATETARVSFPASVSTAELIQVVEQAGYSAALPASRRAAPAGPGAPAGASAADEVDTLRRLLVSLALAIPVVVLAMVPAVQFRDWQWLSLASASLLAVWGAWPFHRAALVYATCSPSPTRSCCPGVACAGRPFVSAR